MPLFLLSLLLLALTTQAQPSESSQAIRIGANRAFFGTGDVVGPAFYAEYAYSFNPYVALAPRVISGFAHRQDRTIFNHISSFAVNLSVRISPLPRYLPGWSIDIGGLYHRFTNTSGNVFQISGTSQPASGDANHYRENLWGFVGAINGDIIHREKFSLGARLELLTSLAEGYLNADSYQWGVYYSRRF